MNRILLSILMVLLLPPIASAQQPNQWKGLVLDAATQIEAISKLGDPERRDEYQKLHTPIDLLLDRHPRFEKLIFKKGEGFDRAELYFYEGHLKAILIDLHEEIKAGSLSTAYGLEFQPKASVIERRADGRPYQKHEGKVYPSRFPPRYELVAENEKSWVAAYVNNSGFRSMMRDLGGLADDSMAYPGKVRAIWLISKSIRDRAGIEALK